MRLTSSRIKNLLLQPRATWLRVADEPTSFGRLLAGHVLPLAAIPAIAGFVGLSLVGWRMAGTAQAVRLPWQQGLLAMLAVYLAAVIGLLLVGWITNLVAPTFGGRKSPLAALKLVAYGSTAAWLGGVFLAAPALAALTGVAALYSAYQVFTGLPVLMRNPPQRTVPYAAVIVLASAVMGLLVSSGVTHFVVRELLLPAASLATAPAADEITAASRKLSEAAERMEAASARQQAAASSVVAPAGGVLPAVPGVVPGVVAGVAGVDGAASSQPLPGVAATGTPPVTGGDPEDGAIPAPALKAALPEMLGAFTRKEIQMQGGHVKGMVTSNARAEYDKGEQHLRVELLDLGSMSKLMAQAGAAVQGEREDSASAERTWQEGGRTLHENYRKDGSMAQYTTTLRNGVVVELTGHRMTLDEVKAASSQLDLATLEALKRRPPPP